MNPRLSILICTLESRREQFGRLTAMLMPQCPDGDVTVSFMRDAGSENGGLAIGAKRQQLLESATGDFVAFIDDDDEVAPDYVASILPLCNNGVDCVGYLIDCYGYDKRSKDRLERACVSNRFKQWRENYAGFRYVRSPHHLVPVRREHALKAGFEASSEYGEDYGYSMRLLKLGLLKNEAFINRPMYTIRHNPNKVFGA